MSPARSEFDDTGALWLTAKTSQTPLLVYGKAASVLNAPPATAMSLAIGMAVTVSEPAWLDTQYRSTDATSAVPAKCTVGGLAESTTNLAPEAGAVTAVVTAEAVAGRRSRTVSGSIT